MCDLSELFSSKEFVSAAVGGLIAGFFSIAAIALTNRYDRNKAKIASMEENHFFLNAIRSELNFLSDRYCSSVGDRIRDWPVDKPFFVVYRAEENYFSIFDNNGLKIGKLRDETLQRKIVEVYVAAKGMIDLLRANSHMIDVYGDLAHQPQPIDLSLQQAHGTLMQKRWTDLAGNVPALKADDERLRKCFSEAISAIDIYLTKAT